MIRIVFSKVTYTTFKRQVLLFLIILDVFFLTIKSYNKISIHNILLSCMVPSHSINVDSSYFMKLLDINLTLKLS